MTTGGKQLLKFGYEIQKIKWKYLFIIYYMLIIINGNSGEEIQQSQTEIVQSNPNQELSVQQDTQKESELLEQPPLVSTTIETNTEKLSTSIITPTNPCFYVDPDICKNVTIFTDLENENHDTTSSSCQCVSHPTIIKSLVCCNITDITKIISCASNPTKDNNSTLWLNVHIINGTFNEFDISHNFWKLLRSLSVTDGSIKRITNEFTKFSMPECLNISNNNLSEIYPRAFTNLTHLQILDVSHNNLSRIPNLTVQNNLTVDISGNMGMLCASVLEYLERNALKFINSNKTFCAMNQTFNWFNSTDSVPLKQLVRMKQLNSECPTIPGHGNCTCRAEQMVYQVKDGENVLVFTAQVDCSGLGLTELPEKLPSNTINLNVSNNNITSIANHFHLNPSYFNILRFSADNNQISSMFELEGTGFINDFERFSLKRNNIDKIPEYLLSPILETNPSGRILYLGGNKLTCDCNSAKVLKIWLLAQKNNIPDYHEILCRNMPQKIVDLSEIKLCQSPHDWTDYIYYLITAEVILLLALILKVSYDYWIFKTAGYLPWPASKMPKLPCDWLCES